MHQAGIGGGLEILMAGEQNVFIPLATSSLISRLSHTHGRGGEERDPGTH